MMRKLVFLLQLFLSHLAEGLSFTYLKGIKYAANWKKKCLPVKY